VPADERLAIVSLESMMASSGFQHHSDPVREAAQEADGAIAARAAQFRTAGRETILWFMAIRRLAAALFLLLGACTGGASNPTRIIVSLGGPPGLPVSGNGAVWSLQGPHPWLVRIEPATGRHVRTALPSTVMFGRIAVEGGAVWVTSCPAGQMDGNSCPHATLQKLDPRTARTLASVPIGESGVPGFLVSGDGMVWSGGWGQRVEGVDARTGAARTFPLPEVGSPMAAGFGSLWVSGGSKLLRVDIRAGAVQATFPIVAQTVALGPSAVWASDGATITRIDPATNEVVASTPLPGHFDVATDGDLVWLGGRSTIDAPDIEVLRLDPLTNRLVGPPITIAPSASPYFRKLGLGDWHVFMAAVGGRLWLGNQANGQIVGVRAP
jgi:hypothetical protein